MPALVKLTATTLAALMLGTALFATPVFADTTPTAAAVAAPTDRQQSVAIDALRDVLDAMVERGVMTEKQRDVVLVVVRAAGWEGYSIERLGDILAPLVRTNVITTRQRDAILDAVRHSRNTVFRLARVLEELTPRVLSYAQRDAIVDALHRADWHGFSIERLGDILQGLVDHGVVTVRQRAAILDGMR